MENFRRLLEVGCGRCRIECQGVVEALALALLRCHISPGRPPPLPTSLTPHSDFPFPITQLNATIQNHLQVRCEVVGDRF